jgi:hypothetical protein
MKKLLILTVIGMLLAGLGGCRFMECLWRGGPCQQCAAPTATYPAPCQSCNPCDPCGGAPVITPGPETYAPVPMR